MATNEASASAPPVREQQTDEPDVETMLAGRRLSSHGGKWDSLLVSAFTPWERSEPSWALEDLLSEERGGGLLGGRGGGRRRPRALVPGCGRGYDVLLLAAYGFDVYGLDFSPTVMREAARSQTRLREEGAEVYRTRAPGEGAGRGWTGEVTWLAGDFFEDEWLGMAGTREFDLIYDHTHFCSNPPEGRPRWAKRMSELLSRDGGRLVCLEWPLHKSPSAPGPPWGVTARMYRAHLARPGEGLPYGDNGRLAESITGEPVAKDGLKRVARIKPRQTHRAGYDSQGNVTDFISVWSR